MGTNNNAVVTAKNFLAAAREFQLDLQDEYDQPRDLRDQGRIAGLHQQINFGFKSAEISALIGIAEELQIMNRQRPDLGPNLTQRLAEEARVMGR